VSTLLILKRIMAKIDSESSLKPCDDFDMMCGSGTGGHICSSPTIEQDTDNSELWLSYSVYFV